MERRKRGGEGRGGEGRGGEIKAYLTIESPPMGNGPDSDIRWLESCITCVLCMCVCGVCMCVCIFVCACVCACVWVGM